MKNTERVRKVKPECDNPPHKTKWFDTPDFVKREIGLNRYLQPIQMVACRCKTTNKDLSSDPIEGTEATVMTNPEPTESPDL